MNRALQLFYTLTFMVGVFCFGYVLTLGGWDFAQRLLLILWLFACLLGLAVMVGIKYND